MSLDQQINEINASIRAGMERRGLGPEQITTRSWGYPVNKPQRPVSFEVSTGGALVPEDVTAYNSYFLNLGIEFRERNTRQGKLIKYTEGIKMVLVGYALDPGAVAVCIDALRPRSEVFLSTLETDPVKVNSLYLQLEKPPEPGGRVLFAIAFEMRLPVDFC